jgi:hypothetical protein
MRCDRTDPGLIAGLPRRNLMLYGVAGALATLTVVTAVLAAITSRTTKTRLNFLEGGNQT